MKKVLYFFAVAFCLIVINNLTHSIVDLWQKQSFLVAAQQSLQQEKQKNQQLQQQLKKISQRQFIEEQARDKLLLVQPGEEVVLLPTGVLQSVQTVPSQSITPTKPHWQEWWDFLFD